MLCIFWRQIPSGVGPVVILLRQVTITDTLPSVALRNVKSAVTVTGQLPGNTLADVKPAVTVTGQLPGNTITGG